MVALKFLLVMFISWVSAHILKGFFRNKTEQQSGFVRELFMSGGMPSSHAASVVSVWTLVLFIDGLNSTTFGMATLLVLIVCYDAVKVRRSTGEQGDAIAKIINQEKLDIKKPHSARGHKPTEVLAGSILGFLIGFLVFITL